jgi:predicted nucleic-acid-binding Zn-ribbon protein
MSESPSCPKCGGPMDEGQLESSIFYTSDKDKRPSLWSLDPKVHLHRARACLTCGYVELYLDPDRLTKYIQAP